MSLFLVDPPIDEVAFRTAIDIRNLLQHRPHQPPIRAYRGHIDGNRNLALGDARDLAIISWPEAAIDLMARI